ncbi:Uncharacterized membrane protein [Chryseolinea serpens]|jgi:uncharacterized membrane protein|uniref:Uncharacterized membrane protein n=1 Tax=Chryseolinea serpens TaxID=947013 RepID=A0A1M5M4M8_9BACT|nr:DUF1003 domain-containing protein [Chryseolinea serpens]SHG72208.1 Uncharacterized membrane protein [Chryseolinea serpens]
MDTFISDLSRKEFPVSEKISAKTIQSPILSVMQAQYPQFKAGDHCALTELNMYRQKYIAGYLAKEVGELSVLEATVLEALKNKDTLTDKLNEDEPLTTGQKMADRIAAFGGSWKFIITFFVFLGGWIVLNALWFQNRSFDPYPFILLNLILSCIAALQAPLIMMSQNRQEEKDRERSKKDYMINLKSELEIRVLHEKIDHLMIHQQHELIQIQKVQMEMMQDIMERVGGNGAVKA